MRMLIIAALAILANITTVSAQGSMNKYCVLTSGGACFVTLQPQNAKVDDCAIIAQGLEQQVGTPLPKQYQLACQSDNSFMVSTPKSWRVKNVVKRDFAKPRISQDSIDACGNAWGVP